MYGIIWMIATEVKEMEYDEREEIMKNYFLKFFIELDEAFNVSIIKSSSAIEGYATECNERLKFESKVKPITFYLENAMYRAEIKMARGGYYISCTEVYFETIHV